jgi:hypothetical protein
MAAKVRTVRIGNKKKVKPKPKTERSVRALLQYAKEAKAEDLAETLSDIEVRDLIDAGAQFDAEIKEREEPLKKIKELLRRNAQYEEWITKEGGISSCLFKPKTKTTIETKDLLEKIRELKKQKLFPILFTPVIGSVRKYLGQEDIDEISKTETDDYGTIHFKKT